MSMQMSIRCLVSVYCTLMITKSQKFNVEKIRRIVFSVITVYDRISSIIIIAIEEL